MSDKLELAREVVLLEAMVGYFDVKNSFDSESSYNKWLRFALIGVEILLNCANNKVLGRESDDFSALLKVLKNNVSTDLVVGYDDTYDTNDLNDLLEAYVEKLDGRIETPISQSKLCTVVREKNEVGGKITAYNTDGGVIRELQIPEHNYVSISEFLMESMETYLHHEGYKLKEIKVLDDSITIDGNMVN